MTMQPGHVHWNSVRFICKPKTIFVKREILVHICTRHLPPWNKILKFDRQFGCEASTSLASLPFILELCHHHYFIWLPSKVYQNEKSYRCNNDPCHTTYKSDIQHFRYRILFQRRNFETNMFCFRTTSSILVRLLATWSAFVCRRNVIATQINYCKIIGNLDLNFFF